MTDLHVLAPEPRSPSDSADAQGMLSSQELDGRAETQDGAFASHVPSGTRMVSRHAMADLIQTAKESGVSIDVIAPALIESQKAYATDRDGQAGAPHVAQWSEGTIEHRGIVNARGIIGDGSDIGPAETAALLRMYHDLDPSARQVLMAGLSDEQFDGWIGALQDAYAMPDGTPERLMASGQLHAFGTLDGSLQLRIAERLAEPGRGSLEPLAEFTGGMSWGLPSSEQEALIAQVMPQIQQRPELSPIAAELIGMSYASAAVGQTAFDQRVATYGPDVMMRILENSSTPYFGTSVNDSGITSGPSIGALNMMSMMKNYGGDQFPGRDPSLTAEVANAETRAGFVLSVFRFAERLSSEEEANGASVASGVAVRMLADDPKALLDRLNVQLDPFSDALGKGLATSIALGRSERLSTLVEALIETREPGQDVEAWLKDGNAEVMNYLLNAAQEGLRIVEKEQLAGASAVVFNEVASALIGSATFLGWAGPIGEAGAHLAAEAYVAKRTAEIEAGTLEASRALIELALPRNASGRLYEDGPGEDHMETLLDGLGFGDDGARS